MFYFLIYGIHINKTPWLKEIYNMEMDLPTSSCTRCWVLHFPSLGGHSHSLTIRIASHCLVCGDLKKNGIP
ncbi:Uncharacterized protein TCM_037052 [Theobroma cacao]|uniref:Uncharacterized protein n=1 Tax=Theobroma cacao TaxID=3641 RepID=A0A061GI37_THECC|nr:Uncharacterized protein TCM_037052 [Theobroma cacao]